MVKMAKKVIGSANKSIKIIPTPETQMVFLKVVESPPEVTTQVIVFVPVVVKVFVIVLAVPDTPSVPAQLYV